MPTPYLEPPYPLPDAALAAGVGVRPGTPLRSRMVAIGLSPVAQEAERR